MVINRDEIKVKDLINEFIENSIFLKDYESTDGIINNSEHNYNTAKKVSSLILKAVKQLLSTEEGLSEFIKLLNNKNLVVAASAAEILYPLYPQKCLKILKQYSKSLKNKLDSYKVDTMIEGLQQKQSFFIDNFCKLYKCDNIDTLNRENSI